MCILSALLKVVSYHDLSVLSMLLMGFQKKKFGWGLGGWGELYPNCLGFFFFFFFNFAEPLSTVKPDACV